MRLIPCVFFMCILLVDDFVIPPNKRKYIFYTASPFPKKFVRALEELLDRFGLSQSPDGGLY